MKAYSTNYLKSYLAGIFLFLAIVKGIDFGLLNINFLCSGDLPWKPNTEYFQDTELIRELNISYHDFYDFAGYDKTPDSHPFLRGISHLKRKFIIYHQRLPKQENLPVSSVSIFLVSSKSNIPHLNSDDEDHPAFSPDVVNCYL